MISKFQIYDYWKDKAITKNFDVKCTCDCSDADEAISITEFDDEIF